MPAIAVIGGQWGDEGKGKVVDLVAEQADAVGHSMGGLLSRLITSEVTNEDYVFGQETKDKQTKGLVMSRFDIDIAKCMYCGLCSEPCPTGAIHLGNL